jgi:Ser/Thr protein kinase RdoA (MazF antagonist)
MPSLESAAEHLHYGIRGRIEGIPKGRADNFLVERDGSRCLFNVLQPEYTEASDIEAPQDRPLDRTVSGAINASPRAAAHVKP